MVSDLLMVCYLSQNHSESDPNNIVAHAVVITVCIVEVGLFQKQTVMTVILYVQQWPLLYL